MRLKSHYIINRQQCIVPTCVVLLLTKTQLITALLNWFVILCFVWPTVKNPTVFNLKWCGYILNDLAVPWISQIVVDEQIELVIKGIRELFFTLVAPVEKRHLIQVPSVPCAVFMGVETSLSNLSVMSATFKIHGYSFYHPVMFNAIRLRCS